MDEQTLPELGICSVIHHGRIGFMGPWIITYWLDPKNPHSDEQRQVTVYALNAKTALALAEPKIMLARAIYQDRSTFYNERILSVLVAVFHVVSIDKSLRIYNPDPDAYPVTERLRLAMGAATSLGAPISVIVELSAAYAHERLKMH